MQYFKQKKNETAAHQRVFRVPVDLDDYDDDELPDEAPRYTSYTDEMAERRKDTFRILTGLADFAGVVAGAVAILVLLAVLVSLLNWVRSDILQSFDLWQPRL